MSYFKELKSYKKLNACRFNPEKLFFALLDLFLGHCPLMIHDLIPQGCKF
jgi:hypothetical protein